MNDLHDMYHQVLQAAYEIINRKKSAYYGIGLALNRLVQAILNDERAICMVSAYLEGEYEWLNLYIRVLSVTGKVGITEGMRLHLNELDQAKFNASAQL